MRNEVKNYLLIIVFFITFLYGCSNGNEARKNDRDIPSVVVFEQALYPLNFKVPFKDIKPIKTDAGVISYVVRDSIVYYNPSKANDTLLLNNPNHYMELRFDCLFEDYCYLIAPNDTVSFSVDEYGRPTLKSKTSEILTKLYNLPYEKESDTQFLCYRPLTGLFNFSLASNHFSEILQKRIIGEYEGVKISIADLKKSYKSRHKRFVEEIAELTRTDSIPKEFIDYFHYRKVLNNYYFELSQKSRKNELSENADATNFFNDKYIVYPSYYKFLEEYIYRYFNQKEGVARIKQPTGSDPDWRKTYEKLSVKDYPIKTKLFMQKHAIEKMSKLFSAKSIKKYLDDYLLQTGDSATVDAIVNPHGLSASDKNMVAEKMLLKDMQGNRTTLKEVLKEHRGSVLYIDFWASWCVPCMSLMPDSRELHQRYADRKVEFLYFSMDENENAWKRTAKKAGVEANNYLVLNPKEAPIMRELKIHSIPRYLVFDKAGKLVDRDAPRPNEGQIETILDKYLKE